ncbi:70-kilodalton heat shock protein [Mortierella sp. 14UC]|nr:70-kilodalton heat shock protein [Mortierella sp. 14UC]
MVAIGIDLGTAYSKVAVWKGDHVEIIADEDGNRNIPSYVAFTETERLLGQDAEDQVTFNPRNTIFNTKRLIGRRFHDKDFQEVTYNTPFEIIEKKGKPYYKVQYKNASRELAAEEITAMIITKLRQIAESHLGATVTDAVISVPTSFNDAQLQATKDAGAIAGLHIRRIIKEPSAAAIAYALNNKVSEQKNILIFDLGASILDVTLVNIEDSVMEVWTTARNDHLGGQDFDNRLVDALVQECKRWKYKDISSDTYALLRLRTACERAKRTLTSAKETIIVIDSLANDIDFSATITRARFEELNQDLFESALEPVRKVLRDAKLHKDAVDEIVLVGGSSRIPKVQQLLSGFFGGRELNTSLDADEAVVRGAAFMARRLTGSIPSRFEDFLLVDAMSHTIGTGGSEGEMVPVLRHNTSLPNKRIEVFSTKEDNESTAMMSIYEGEHKQAQDNHFLGTLMISGIPSAPRKVPQLEVFFDLGCDGILEVFEAFKTDGSTPKVRLIKGGLSRHEIERMTKDAEGYRAEDEADALLSRRGRLSPIPDWRPIEVSFD